VVREIVRRPDGHRITSSIVDTNWPAYVLAPSQSFKVALQLPAVVDDCVRIATVPSASVRPSIVRTPLPTRSLR